MKKAAFAVISTLILAATASAQIVGAWTRLEGQHSLIPERRTVAVTDALAWERLWKEHDANAPVPEVNFDEESVVVVFLGETRTAGTKVDVVVQNDTSDPSRLNVFYRAVLSAQSFTAQMICRPFVMLKVRKVAVVAFEMNGRMSIPENPEASRTARNDAKIRKMLENQLIFDGR